MGMVLVTSVESLKSWIILKELEIDYLWITPVFISPMNDNGYDVADYYKESNPQFWNHGGYG